MSTFVGPCVFCGQQVAERHAAFPVSGWEPLREQGGANRIIDRQRDGHRVAHIVCAERRADLRRRGISPDQASLV